MPPHTPLQPTTNLPGHHRANLQQASLKSFLSAQSENKKRQSRLNFGAAPTSNKRIRLWYSHDDLDDDDDDDAASSSESEWVDSDVELIETSGKAGMPGEEALGGNVSNTRQRFKRSYNQVTVHPNPTHGAFRSPHLQTTPILRSFVSSHKSDLFKCESDSTERFLAPPYACAYSHRAKSGANSSQSNFLLAVADEEGCVRIINTSKRDSETDCQEDALPEIMARLHPHSNGIFAVKWNSDDSAVATCSGDQTARVTDVTTGTTTHTLSGSSSTVKCIVYDPEHRDLIATGSRGGDIGVYDLRSGPQRCIHIPTAHRGVGNDRRKPPGRKPKNASAPPGITALLAPRAHALVSGATSDGILKYWDLRYLMSDGHTSSRRPKPQHFASPEDPTTLNSGSRRARGILSLALGNGPTAGLIFALGADSRVHTYAAQTLQPYPKSVPAGGSKSFYVSISISPCGRWLASGGTEGTATVFDVVSPRVAVKLQAQVGEVGAVDWAEGALATCADDGTVRVWRPDVSVHRRCLEDPEEQKWNWAWATSQEETLVI